MPSKCKDNNCTKRGIYNYDRGDGAYCSIHRTDGMINLYKSPSKKRKLEETEVSDDTSVENTPIDNQVQSSVKRRKYSYKKCKNDQCNRIAMYGFPSLPGEFCSKHMLIGMVNRRTRLCTFPTCVNVARYNMPDQYPIYCRLHKQPNMINRRDRLCIKENCTKIALFNDNDKPPMYCYSHKTNDMILRKSNKCIVSGCNTRACFGLPLDTKPKYCNKHKLPLMINKIYTKFGQTN